MQQGLGGSPLTSCDRMASEEASRWAIGAMASNDHLSIPPHSTIPALPQQAANAMSGSRAIFNSPMPHAQSTPTIHVGAFRKARAPGYSATRGGSTAHFGGATNMSASNMARPGTVVAALTQGFGGSSKSLQRLHREHREDHDGTRSRLLSKVAPPLSRFKGEDEEMVVLARVLQKAAKERMASRLAVESVAKDFERDFPLTDGKRYAVGQLVSRGAAIASRFDTMSRSLEAAAASSLSVSQQGAIEREATIQALQIELERGEVDLSEEVLHAREGLERDIDFASKEHSTMLRLLEKELRNTERSLKDRDDQLQAIILAQEEAEASREQTEEEKKAALLSHLQRVAVMRLFKVELSRG